MVFADLNPKQPEAKTKMAPALPILSPELWPVVPGKLFGLDRVTVDKCWLWLSRGRGCLSPGVAVG